MDSSNNYIDINKSTMDEDLSSLTPLTSQIILSTLSSITAKLPSTTSSPVHHSIGFNVFCIVLSCLVLIGMTVYLIYLLYIHNSIRFIDYKIERKKENAYLFYFK